MTYQQLQLLNKYANGIVYHSEFEADPYFVTKLGFEKGVITEYTNYGIKEIQKSGMVGGEKITITEFSNMTGEEKKLWETKTGRKIPTSQNDKKIIKTIIRPKKNVSKNIILGTIIMGGIIWYLKK